MKWNISVVNRKETKRDFVSTGEGKRKRPKMLNEGKNTMKDVTKKGESPVLNDKTAFCE